MVLTLCLNAYLSEACALFLLGIDVAVSIFVHQVIEDLRLAGISGQHQQGLFACFGDRGAPALCHLLPKSLGYVAHQPMVWV